MPRVSGRCALVAVVGAAVLSFNFGSRLLLTNATTDLRELRAVVAQAPAPLSALDLQDLALSFNLDRPVVNTKDYQRFEARARQGNPGYLIISDRALATQPAAPCMRRRSVAAGPDQGRRNRADPDPARRPLAGGARRALRHRRTPARSSMDAPRQKPRER